MIATIVPGRDVKLFPTAFSVIASPQCWWSDACGRRGNTEGRRSYDIHVSCRSYDIHVSCRSYERRTWDNGDMDCQRSIKHNQITIPDDDVAGLADADWTAAVHCRVTIEHRSWLLSRGQESRQTGGSCFCLWKLWLYMESVPDHGRKESSHCTHGGDVCGNNAPGRFAPSCLAIMSNN